MMSVRTNAQDLDELSSKSGAILKLIDSTESDVKKLVDGANDLGVPLPSEADVAIKQLQAYRSELSETKQRTAKASDGLFALLG